MFDSHGGICLHSFPYTKGVLLWQSLTRSEHFPRPRFGSSSSSHSRYNLSKYTGTSMEMWKKSWEHVSQLVSRLQNAKFGVSLPLFSVILDKSSFCVLLFPFHILPRLQSISFRPLLSHHSADLQHKIAGLSVPGWHVTNCNRWHYVTTPSDIIVGYHLQVFQLWCGCKGLTQQWNMKQSFLLEHGQTLHKLLRWYEFCPACPGVGT